MAISRTVNEARDSILERINNKGSAQYQTIVIRLLNDALTAISTMHDWLYLYKYTTFSTTDAVGTATLPSDYDRPLSVHQSGAEYSLTELRPQDFALAEESDAINAPYYFCYAGFAQDTDIENPSLSIKIALAPASGTEFELWYIKQVEEIEASDTIIPNLPVHIWDLVQRMATLEALKMVEAPEQIQAIEQSHFSTFLNQYKRRETYGAAKMKSMRLRGNLIDYRSKIRSR